MILAPLAQRMWLPRFLLVAFVGVGAQCPSGWSGETSEACFQIPEEQGTFVECQDTICESLGGTLASIRSQSEQDFVRRLMREEGALRAYIGIFESGEDESGVWKWVDGFSSNFTHWSPGEPSEYCTDEDCGMYMPTWFPLGWVDTSCTLENWAQCLCRLGGTPSDEYLASKSNLNANDNDYQKCYDENDDDGSEEPPEDLNNICAAAGFGSAAFTPNVVAYPGTICADISFAQLEWADCCCGGPVEDKCCASGDSSCMDGVDDDDADAPLDSLGDCPSPFQGPYDDACFFVSQEFSTFVDCEEKVCEPLGGTLASIRNAEEEAYLERLIGFGAAYIGGFESGEDESGRWRWVDGGSLTSGYSNWAPGDPNNWCVDEDCVLFAPAYFPGWIDASCTIGDSVTCVCRYGGYSSVSYALGRQNLLSASNDYSDCTKDDGGNVVEDDEDDEGTFDYCEANGFSSSQFAPYVSAYPPENARFPEVSEDGYEEGLCGFAAWERDGRWANCCCEDRTYCCPDGEDKTWCKSSETYNADCPRGWSGPGDSQGCFKLTDIESSFVGCQDICSDEGGTLASVRTSEEQQFVRNMLVSQGADGFIGYFEYGEDESGDWRWIDGSEPRAYEGWALGEPDNWCLDEDCAVFTSTLNNWMDVSCAIKTKCVCRYGGEPSPQYMESMGALSSANADYRSCGEEPKSSVQEDSNEDNEEEELLEIARAMQGELTALLILICLLVIAALAVVFFLVKRHYAAMRAMHDDPLPAYGVELGATTSSDAVYNHLVTGERGSV